MSARVQISGEEKKKHHFLLMRIWASLSQFFKTRGDAISL